MKEKLIQALKTKYKNLGFSDKAFDGVADYLAKTVVEENQIDNAISGVEILLKSFQGDVDKRVTEAIEKTKKEYKPDAGADPKKTEPKENQIGEDVPTWAKALIESNKLLSNELNTLKNGQTTQTRKQQLEGVLKEANPIFSSKILKDFSRLQFKNDEDFNAYVEETKTDIANFSQTMANEGLKNEKPLLGNSGSEKVSPIVQEYINDKTKPETIGNLGGKKL